MIMLIFFQNADAGGRVIKNCTTVVELENVPDSKVHGANKNKMNQLNTV